MYVIKLLYYSSVDELSSLSGIAPIGDKAIVKSAVVDTVLFLLVFVTSQGNFKKNFSFSLHGIYTMHAFLCECIYGVSYDMHTRDIVSTALLFS